MDKRVLLLSILIVFYSSFLNAFSGTSFSKDKDSFFQELHTLFKTKSDKDAYTLISAIELKANSGSIGELEFKTMVDICNDMSSLKMRPKPYYWNYLSALDVVDSKEIQQWHILLSEILKNTRQGKFKPYNKFLEFSHHYFKKDMLRYSKTGICWISDSSNEVMELLDGKPVIKFEKGNLIAKRKGSQISIVNAAGTFYPLENKWIGKGGKVSWQRLESISEISCNLIDYEIDFTKNSYTATKAYLSYPKYFNNKLVEGTLQDKLLLNNNKKESSFPKFESKADDLDLDNLAPGIKFRGGVLIEGLTLKGSNSGSQKATMEYEIPDSDFKSKMTAKSFSINKDGKISSNQSETTLYFGKDSIYHPGANLKFVPGETITLFSGKKSASKAPFYDSYFKTYFYTNKLVFDIKEDKVIINPPGSGSRQVSFESEHYFDKNYINRIQNVSSVNPIILLHILTLDYGKNLEAITYAKRINPRFDISNIQNLLFDLERHGFITYNTDNQELIITPKVELYSESQNEKIDFDIINLSSSNNEANAIYDRKNQEITIEGVEKLVLQNRQPVAIKPTNKSMVMKQNRNLDFDGKTYAGITYLTSKKNHFNYEDFNIKMDSVRYFDLFFPADETYEFDDQKFYAIGSRIENTSGVLQINDVNNKSGKDKITEYPYFETDGPAFVYYDNENKQGKCYKRDSFFFELAPFKLNSLDSLVTESFQFDGKLNSFGIFPEFKETLLLQKEDQSLGFTSTTPSTGYSMYKNTGKFNGEIHLSNKGLLGNGEINYADTKVNSSDLVLKPKIATGSAEVFHLKEDKSKSIPEVRGENVFITWKPYNDSMVVTSRDKSFELFNQGQHKIGGTLVSTSSGLKGKGIFQWGQGEMDSNLFDFGAFAVKSEKTDLKIQGMETDALAFETKDLNGNIDFESQMGRFKSNKENSLTKMPANYYVTTLNEFEWDLGKKALTFISEKDKMGLFVSSHPDQDSLSFEGKTANYDFQSGKLTIGGVEKISVADAFIIPNKNTIIVETGGYIQKLEGAMISANQTNNYHTFTDATIRITGKYNYEGKGLYEYTVGYLTQTIDFSNISGSKRGKGKYSEKKAVTMASKRFLETDKFYLDPKTFFYGDIDLVATNPYLDFNGFAKLDAKVLANSEWFSVKFQGDKNKMLIASDKPENPEGTKLYSGIYLNGSNTSNYANILMPLKEETDRCLFDANGVFQYDFLNKNFIFGSEAKMKNESANGNLLYFNEQNGSLTALGNFNICPNVRGLKVSLIGEAKTGFEAEKLTDSSLSNKNLAGTFVTKLDLLLPKNLMKIIEEDFLFYKDSLTEVKYMNKPLYRTATNQWSSNAKIQHFAMSELNLKDNFYVKEKKNPSNFVLAAMDMKWSKKKEAFVGAEKMITLNSINGKEFNRKINATVAFIMPSNEDDRIYLFLQNKNDNYYFLNYKKGILHVQSNNPIFNETVEKMKPKARTVKLPDGKTYEVQLTTPEMVVNFRKSVKDW